MVMVVDDRLTPSTVLVFLFYDGGAVGRLSLFDYGRVVPIPVVIVVFAHSYASANRANAYPNTNISARAGVVRTAAVARINANFIRNLLR